MNTLKRLPANENASGVAEASKPNHCTENIAEKVDPRQDFKRSILFSATQEVVGGLVATPADTSANDLMQEEDGSAELPDLMVPSVVVSVPASRYQLLTDAELCKLPPIQWSIKNVLPSNGLAVLYGPSGSGKSFLVLDMLQSLASGGEWFGQKVKQCSVTYIALEGEAGLAGRMDAYRSWHGATSSNIRYMVQSFKLMDADDINGLVQAIKTAGTGDVVVVDTLNRATPGLDENDSKSMGLIISTAKLLQELIGGLVMFIHHTGKEASRGMRGHSSLHAALDCAIEVKCSGEHREWVVAKSKDGEDGACHPFKLEVVSLGHDSDGDPITSCVIVPDHGPKAVQAKKPTLGSNQAIAYKALKEPLSKSVEIDKDGAPPGRPCMSVDDAVVIVAPQILVAPKHQKARAKEAIEGLVRKDVIGRHGDWIWDNQLDQN